MKPKKELIRVVKNKQNEFSIDFSGKKAGRGAYICRNISCFENARKGKRFEKSFKSMIDKEIYEMLKQELEKQEEKEKQEKQDEKKNL